MTPEITGRDELSRKVLDQVESLILDNEVAAISDRELGIAIKAISGCVLGMINRDTLEVLSAIDLEELMKGV